MFSYFFDVNRSYLVAVFKVEDGIVHELLELENGNLAMTGIKDSKIRIFDFISGRLKKELEGHNDYVMEMRSIPSKHTLLSYSCDKTIKLWSTKHNFMLLKSIERPGIINKLFIFNPELLLIQESQGTYFKPNNITQILSLKSKTIVKKFDKSTNLGVCLGVLSKSDVVVFTKNGESSLKFYKFTKNDFELISEYFPKYNIRECYQLDKKKVVVTFRDVGVFSVYDFAECKEIYSLCPHTNDILNVSIRQYHNIETKTLKRRTSLDLSFLLRREAEEIKNIDEELKETLDKISELDNRNFNKLIISGGRDRTIVISDVVEMKKLGEINLKNCSMEGYRFTGLRRKEEVWVCTLNGYIYVYDLKEIVNSEAQIRLSS